MEFETNLGGLGDTNLAIVSQYYSSSFGQIFVKIFQKSHFELYALMRWCCLGDIALSINSNSGRTGADRVNNMDCVIVDGYDGTADMPGIIE